MCDIKFNCVGRDDESRFNAGYSITCYATCSDVVKYVFRLITSMRLDGPDKSMMVAMYLFIALSCRRELERPE
jgi:hypothetical protein